MLTRGEPQKDAKKLNFEIFESALYTKSGSIPLSGNKMWCVADNHNHMCHICVKGFSDSNFD